MNFEDIPPEIVIMIFSYLTQQELCAVSQVSKRFCCLAFDPTLWKKITLNGLLDTKDDISTILKKSSLAREVKFQCVNDFSWITSLPKCETVQKLEFENCRFDENTVSHFVNLQPRVCTLSILDSQVNFQIINRIVKWELLKSITLCDWEFCDYNNEDDECLKLIAEKCTNLEELHLPSLYLAITDSAFLIFIKLRGPQLKSLSISCDNLTSVSYQSLKCCHRLERLHLYANIGMTEADEEVINNLDALIEIYFEEDDL